MKPSRAQARSGGVRALLEKSHGREYWRSLEDLAATDAFQDLMHREFPRYALGVG
jgi:hypothetical protein